jgi:hypothetical protein
VAVDVAVERLLAGVLDLDRPTRREGEQADVDLEADVLAGAERAADAGEGEVDLLERQPEAGGHLGVVDVEPLGGDQQLDAAVLGGHGHAGLRPEEGLVLHADLVGPLDADLAGRVRVAVAETAGGGTGCRPGGSGRRRPRPRGR